MKYYIKILVGPQSSASSIAEMDSSDRDSNSKNIRPTKSPSSALICSSMLPTAPAPRWRRGWRWRRWRRCHSPVMRGRGRRWRHPPMVAVVMMMVVRDHAAIHVSSGERGSGECDCGERRDEFDLVHGMVPFFAWGYVFR